MELTGRPHVPAVFPSGKGAPIRIR